jgi:hypothetical protein
MTTKTIVRNRSVGIKLTEDEYARLEQIAAERSQNLGEAARMILFEKLNLGHQIILAETIGLRDILVNLLHAYSQGISLTQEYIETIMREADANKTGLAIERLQSLGEESEDDEVSGTN